MIEIDLVSPVDLQSILMGMNQAHSSLKIEIEIETIKVTSSTMVLNGSLTKTHQF